ncbi:MAG: DNA-binding protein [Candidatus Bathyarchaeia archaeon]
MSEDLELEMIRRKRLLELQRRLMEKEAAKEDVEGPEPPERLLDKVFEGRAWEVWNAAEAQYPKVSAKVKKALIDLISQGKVKRISGEQLMYLFRKIGLQVRLPTKIRIVESGEVKTLEEKLKENRL